MAIDSAVKIEASGGRLNLIKIFSPLQIHALPTEEA